MRFLEEEFKKPLSNKELIKYIELAQNGDEKAYQIVVEHNLRLIADIILKQYYSLNDETKSELFEIGCLALCIAIKKFDISFKIQFSTYVSPVINGEFKNFLNNNYQFHIPQSLKDIYSKINALQESNINNKLDYKTLAKILNISEIDVIEAINAHQNIISIYSINDENCKILDTIPEFNSTVEKNIEEREKIEDLMIAINKLDKIEKNMILLYFGINCEKKTQTEIAEMLNLSQAQISKLIKKALKKLKFLLPQYLKDDYRTNFTNNNNVENNNEKTIYSYFKIFSKEDINKVLESFNEEERKLILIKYPYNEEDYNPKSISIYAKQNNIDYAKIYYKVDRLIKKLNKQLINKSNTFNKKSIYSFFELYLKEDVDKALEEFNEEERKLILIKYPYNEEDYNPKSISIYAKQNNIDYAKIYYKINRLVKNLNKKLVSKNFISNNKVKKYK